jgi:hypothetical protein
MLYVFDDGANGDPKSSNKMKLRVIDPTRFAQVEPATVEEGEAKAVLQVVLKVVGALPDFSQVPLTPVAAPAASSTKVEKTAAPAPVAAPVAAPSAPTPAPAAPTPTPTPAAPAPAAVAPTTPAATTGGALEKARILVANDWRIDGKKCPRPELKDLAIELGCTGVSTATSLPVLKEKIGEAVKGVGAPAPAATPAPVAAPAPAPTPAAPAPTPVPAIPTGAVPPPPNGNAPAAMPTVPSVPTVPAAQAPTGYPAPTVPTVPSVPSAPAPQQTVVPASNPWQQVPAAAPAVDGPGENPGEPKSAEDVVSRNLRFDEAASETARNGKKPEGFVVFDQWNNAITVPLFVYKAGQLKPMPDADEWLKKNGVQ